MALLIRAGRLNLSFLGGEGEKVSINRESGEGLDARSFNKPSRMDETPTAGTVE